MHYAQASVYAYVGMKGIIEDLQENSRPLEVSSLLSQGEGKISPSSELSTGNKTIITNDYNDEY